MSWVGDALARRQQQPQQPQYGQPPVGYQRPQAPPPSVPGYGPNPAAQPPQEIVQQDGRIIVPEGVQLSAYQRAAAAVGDKGRTSVCPECGADGTHGLGLYQPTTSENGMPLRFPPKPHCTNCGWPNMQASSLHGAASVAKATGPTKQTRQLKGHAVEIYNDRGRVVDVYGPQTSSIAGEYV